jgi:hypothetical protein
MPKRKHKPKVHPGADIHAGRKGGNRTSHHGRAKGALAKSLPKENVEQFRFGKQNAMRRPKVSEPDNVGRLVRPAAHNARQTGVAARARKTVKRLSDQVI